MLFGKANFEVKSMYYCNSNYYVKSGYVVNHIPQVVSMNEVGSFNFGEDPGDILDDVRLMEEIEKLTR